MSSSSSILSNQDRKGYVENICLVLKKLYGKDYNPPFLSKDQKRRILRVMEMATSLDLSENLAQKAQDLSFDEKEFISDEIKKGTPVEQLILFVDAPRESLDPKIKTRDDIQNSWERNDLDLAITGEKTPIVRTQNFIASYGALMVGVSLIIKGVAHAHPNPWTTGLDDVLDKWKDETISIASSLNPLTGVVAAFVFLAPLYRRYLSQKNIPKVSLSKTYTPTALTESLKNSPLLQSKLKEIHPSEHVLLQHLATPDSDETLRLFLVSNDRVKKEIFKRYPPPFQARMDHLFRRYNVENKSRNWFLKSLLLPRRILEIAATQIAPNSMGASETMARLKSQRKKLKK